MKLEITLSGKFYRHCVDNISEESLDLSEWILSFQQVATEVRQRSPQLLQEKFGLSFLPKSSLIRLLVSANQTTEIYEIPSLHWLKPVNGSAKQYLPKLYQYKFVSDQAEFDLEADDPQLPCYWQCGETCQTGTYQFILKDISYPGLSEVWLELVIPQIKKQWQSYSKYEQLEKALNSTEQNNFSFPVQDFPEVKVKVENSELTYGVQEAIAYLRKTQTDFATLSGEAQNLVEEYQTYHSLSPTKIILPEKLNISTSNPPPHQGIIGKKKSRKAIENLLTQAEKFLFISSYIIEDESVTELICQKVASLPQGVWILTDLRDEIVNNIDTQATHKVNLPENYQVSSAKKAKCLAMLLDAGARIRGGSFHLKTYMCEKAAYLGSCNLTGGSLDFNLEAGLIFKGSATHRDLHQYFLHCWNFQAKYEVLPTPTPGEFIQRTIETPVNQTRFFSQTLLTPAQYKQDLEQQLSQFMGKVEIYSRGFSADGGIMSLLTTRSTSVYVDGSIDSQNSRISWRLMTGFHAKVTLLGHQVAYVGGVNFYFNSQTVFFHDLMYKTSDRTEINLIRQQLSPYSVL